MGTRVIAHIRTLLTRLRTQWFPPWIGPAGPPKSISLLQLNSIDTGSIGGKERGNECWLLDFYRHHHGRVREGESSRFLSRIKFKIWNDRASTSLRGLNSPLGLLNDENVKLITSNPAGPMGNASQLHDLLASLTQSRKIEILFVSRPPHCSLLDGRDGGGEWNPLE